MKKKICMILIAVFVAVLGTSTYFIIDHYKESNKQAALYGELAELVDAAAQTDAATEPAEQIPYSEEKMLLPELAELYQQNGDLVGWISIADTNINYPVMQSVNEPNFYLKHGFDKEYSDYGCPYVQEDCDVQEPSDNLVIYGHHMLLMLVVSMLASSIPLPFIFKLGVEKGRTAYYVMIGFVCGASVLATSFFRSQLGIEIKPNLVLAILAVVGVGVYALSWRMAITFYKKREIQ